MATASDLDLATLARSNAGEFLQAFLEGLGGKIGITSVYEIEELNGDNVFDGIHIELVSSEGGHEGGGEYVERVFAINRGDETLSHMRVTGFYQSYNGTEYNDDWTLVAPREVVVTQYFDIK
jgi:hypothetical protein